MKHSIVFETERTFASHWATANVAETFEIYSDAEVTRWTYGTPEPSLESMQEKIAYFIERNTKFQAGMGSFPVYQKESGQLIGNAMIKLLPDTKGNFTEDIEIGWHLRRSVWGQGYATEFGRKLIEIGFNELGLSKLHAVVGLENVGSARVAERLGMKDIGQTTDYYHGEPIMHFVLKNSNR